MYKTTCSAETFSSRPSTIHLQLFYRRVFVLVRPLPPFITLERTRCDACVGERFTPSLEPREAGQNILYINAGSFLSWAMCTTDGLCCGQTAAPWSSRGLKSRSLLSFALATTGRRPQQVVFVLQRVSLESCRSFNRGTRPAKEQTESVSSVARGDVRSKRNAPSYSRYQSKWKEKRLVGKPALIRSDST